MKRAHVALLLCTAAWALAIATFTGSRAGYGDVAGGLAAIAFLIALAALTVAGSVGLLLARRAVAADPVDMTAEAALWFSRATLAVAVALALVMFLI